MPYIEGTGNAKAKQREETWMSVAKEPETLSKGTYMNAKLLISAVAASLIALTGCGTNPTNAQIGTATGAILGGVVGSSVTGGSTIGTVGGAAAGALIGNEVGKKR